MARQDRLEALVKEDSNDALVGHRAVIQFIDGFSGIMRDNLISQNEANKMEASGESDPEVGNPYMDISPDLDENTAA